jgi:RNA polymerase sigma factor (sigma-70 family)
MGPAELPGAPGDAAPRVKFHDLIAQARDGFEEAINRIVTDYGGYILIAVRRIMPRDDPVREVLDSVDVQQEVLLRLFQAVRNGNVPLDSEAFRDYVKTLAANTARSEIRRHTAQKRSVHRTEALSAATCDVAGTEPGPAQLAEFHEDWQRLLRSVLPAYRVVLECRAAGWTAPEIADHFSLPLRTVESILKKYWERWQEMRRGGGASKPRPVRKRQQPVRRGTFDRRVFVSPAAQARNRISLACAADSSPVTVPPR